MAFPLFHLLATALIWHSVHCEQGTTPDQRKLPRCGETFSTSTGGIYHKPFEPVVDNERCIWILGVPEAVGYTITIEYLGPPTNQEASGQELSFTGMAHGNTSSPILKTILPTATGEFTITDSHLVIVSFHSPVLNGQQSTGFAMRYQSILTGNISSTALISTHHLLESPTFEFKYPATGNYANNELTVFAFLPVSNLNNGKTNDVWYKISGLQLECLDALYIYHFAVVSGHGSWQESGQICSDTVNLHIPYDDTTVVVFQSDNTTVSSGFWFWYTAC